MATYSVSLSVFGEMPLAPALDAVAAAGFSEVELTARHFAVRRDGFDLGAVRRALREAGVRPRTLHSIVPNLGATDEGERRIAVAGVAMQFAPFGDLGGETVVVHPNTMTNGITPENRTLTMTQSRRSLAELAQRAEPLGVRIAAENMLRFDSVRPCCDMKELRFVIEALPQAVGLILDVGHALCNGLDPIHEARAAGERLYALHIQDTDGVMDRHWLPGHPRGRLDGPGLIAALDAMNYLGPRTIELSPRLGEPREVLHKARRAHERSFEKEKSPDDG
jgi:sugar phosphate isomerase/epimerase